MNMLTNISLPQLDEAAMISPNEEWQPDTSRVAIQAGVRRARILRARAFLAAAGRRLHGQRGLRRRVRPTNRSVSKSVRGRSCAVRAPRG